MLFFFELQLFVMLLLTVILGEVAGRGAALIVWSVFTVLSLVGERVARRHWGQLTEAPEAAPANDETRTRWTRQLLHTWRRSNILMVVGTIGFGAWYGLAR